MLDRCSMYKIIRDESAGMNIWNCSYADNLDWKGGI